MSRSLRLRKNSIRHGFIAATALMLGIASASWMCAALLYEDSLCAITALCVTALAAFITWVEGSEAARLRHLYQEEVVRELRSVSFFQHTREWG